MRLRRRNRVLKSFLPLFPLTLRYVQAVAEMQVQSTSTFTKVSEEKQGPWKSKKSTRWVLLVFIFYTSLSNQLKESNLSYHPQPRISDQLQVPFDWPNDKLLYFPPNTMKQFVFPCFDLIHIVL